MSEPTPEIPRAERDPHLPPDMDARVRKIELTISTLLRTGVAVSLGLVVAGVVIGLVRHPDHATSRTLLATFVTPGDRTFPHSIGDVLSGLARLDAQAVIALGLLLLIATPVMRVAISIFAFRAQGDRVYTRITTIVLLLLLLSFVLGKSG